MPSRQVAFGVTASPPARRYGWRLLLLGRSLRKVPAIHPAWQHLAIPYSRANQKTTRAQGGFLAYKLSTIYALLANSQLARMLYSSKALTVLYIKVV